MRVSHETIYLSLFMQARGALKRELSAHLRRSRSIRRPRAAKKGNAGQGQIADAVSIRERPPEVEDRAIPATGKVTSCPAPAIVTSRRWSSDTRAPDARRPRGQRHSHRDQRAHPRGAPVTREAKSLAHLGSRNRDGRPCSLHRCHRRRRYFCDPQSPWQRGSNENTNGLLRQYLPKGTNLASYSQAQLDEIANKLNTRPRETLGFRTPAIISRQRCADDLTAPSLRGGKPEGDSHSASRTVSPGRSCCRMGSHRRCLVRAHRLQRRRNPTGSTTTRVRRPGSSGRHQFKGPCCGATPTSKGRAARSPAGT